MFASKDLFFTNNSGGYQISRSVRLRSSASAYLNRTLGTSTNGQKFTWSGWVKRGKLGILGGLQHGYSASNNQGGIYFNTGDTLNFSDYPTSSNALLTTTALYRDPSAWYHIVVAADTTQATASNRVLMYVNGVQITSFSTATYPTQNTVLNINKTANTGLVGEYYDGTNNYFDGYLAEVNFIDGQQLTPSSFGTTNAITGVWQPAKYTGTYGTNGFYLNFNNNASTTTLGYDTSGNSNNWTPNNISVTAGVTYDSMTDVPTLTSATASNYCVMNPLKTGGITASNANLTVNGNASNTSTIVGTIGVSSGKWYWEFTVGSTDQNSMIGICTDAVTLTNYIGSDANGWGYYGVNGNKYNNATPVAYGASYTNGDVIGVALDADAGILTFYKNNTSQGTAYSSLASNVYFPAYGDTGSAAVPTGSFNFGQRPFSFSPPTGFVALNTYNLPASTISNGSNYMAASTYTGNGSTQSIVNSGNNAGSISFKPDLVWIKSRSAATDHKLTDSVRGATKALISDTTGAETTDANGMTAFNTGGFSLGTDTNYNNNTATYVAWQWQAGAGSSSSNTSGSITSTVSVNTTAGFSVVTYTGTSANATVGHGLGVAPKMVIIKDRGSVDLWVVYHASTGATGYLALNSTNAFTTLSTVWNNTAPTSSVYSVGVAGATNNTSPMVAYCFAEVAGYSKFGSYTGNGSTDGPFVFTGFRPRFVLVKRTDSTGDWYLYDTSRSPYNTTNAWLQPDTASAENSSTTWEFDINSNGFKVRNNGAFSNANGGTYIYACFAENPFKNSLAR
jgi:hypothetical protein